MTRKDKSPSRRDKRRSSTDTESYRRKHKDHKRRDRDRSSQDSRKDRSPSRTDRSSRRKKDKDRQYKHRDRSNDSRRDKSLKRKYQDYSPESSHRKKHHKRDRSQSNSSRKEKPIKEEPSYAEVFSSKRFSPKKEEYDYQHESQSLFKQECHIKQECYIKQESSVKTEDSDGNSEKAARKRKRESKWSSGQAKVPLYLKPDDAEVYSIQIQINSLTTKLAQQNYTEEIETMCRSASPDPVYGHDGKRINTKEYRARERMEERKRNLILRLYALRPDLVPHADKMMGARIEEKVFIPQDDYPDINFAGLIIGPRGMTQKDLEKETGTKILLRGKGSAKPGKLNGGSAPLPGEDEPLHAYITSMSRDSVDRAVEKIKKIIQDGIEFPELQNDLRKNQMKQLAILNGTYRETDGLNKLKSLSEAQSIATNTIICSLCGGTGHLPRDCKVNSNEIPMMEYSFPHVQLEGEYNNFINELGIDEATAKPAYLGFMPSQSSGNSSQGASSFVRNFIFRS